ncbi:hypothetical protein HanIR_Chr09g0399601 [Helianthus annuus]|nr:hypothetical protein HanIR_Chr09g0399601 [Helianthus annuus]
MRFSVVSLLFVKFNGSPQATGPKYYFFQLYFINQLFREKKTNYTHFSVAKILLFITSKNQIQRLLKIRSRTN